MKVFATGVSYGAGVVVGVCSGMVLVGGTAAALFFGYLHLKKFIRDRKNKEEEDAAC